MAEGQLDAGRALHQAGRLQEAAAIYRRLLQAEPGNVQALHLLWAVLSQQGDFTAALEAITAAVLHRPGDGILHSSLGTALMNVGRMSEAEDAYRRAIGHRPDLADAHFSLGYLLEQNGRLAEAEQSLRRAVRLAPDDPLAHNHLGMVLVGLDRPEQAAISLRRAAAINPNSPHAHSNLGSALRALGRLEEAGDCYRRALRLSPTLAAAHTGLGDVLVDLGSLEEATESCRQAIRCEPRYPIAHASLALALMRAGRLAEAESACRRALELKPDLSSAHSNLIFILDLLSTTDTRGQQEERTRWYEQHARKHAPSATRHPNQPDPERPLRLGYVSADFRQHSAYFVFSPMIYRHDRAAFEVFCYSGVKREDDKTTRIRQAADGWRSTLGVSDDALAEQIRRDGIDILVDLSGHSEGHRLLVFARKPAPVQVTAWGHATGTGLKTIDYFFADPLLVPPAERAFYAEEIFDLPSALCYEAPRYAPEVTALPAAKGNPFTFGCVNRLEKITDKAIALWGRILSGAPDSRLLVKDRMLGDLRLKQQFLHRLRDIGGIAPERASLFGPTSHAEHLTIFERIDVGLDPFPQGGGVSTAEALYLGVPIVALRGTTVPSRLTASILNLLRMQDWVAETEDDYVRIAVQKREELSALAQLRPQLRTRLIQSPYGDVANYVKAVERAYRLMWQRWCDRARSAGDL